MINIMQWINGAKNVLIKKASFATGMVINTKKV